MVHWFSSASFFSRHWPYSQVTLQSQSTDVNHLGLQITTDPEHGLHSMSWPRITIVASGLVWVVRLKLSASSKSTKLVYHSHRYQFIQSGWLYILVRFTEVDLYLEVRTIQVSAVHHSLQRSKTLYKVSDTMKMTMSLVTMLMITIIKHELEH